MSNPTPPENPVSDVGQEPAAGYPASMLSRRSSLAAGVLRGALVLLALVVAAGFVLILLPQGALDRLVNSLQSRDPGTPVQEQIAFLYLGDVLKGKEFHIRGVVRNITTAPIEKLDANVRLYSQEGRLLETRVVRLDSETIPPDGVAQFNLIFSDYAGQFGSYSVDFMLRDGGVVPYKDMRGARENN
jgi:hypothetical protein